MERFEQVCIEKNPDAVLVVGDVNSTAASVLVASKLNIKTIHYEAGLRSYDRRIPEEINRVVSDAICDMIFTTSFDADENLFWKRCMTDLQQEDKDFQKACAFLEKHDVLKSSLKEAEYYAELGKKALAGVPDNSLRKHLGDLIVFVVRRDY